MPYRLLYRTFYVRLSIRRDLIKKLLVQDRTKRLGNMKVLLLRFAFIVRQYLPRNIDMIF